jgi:Na+/H+ antiporter NhaB
MVMAVRRISGNVLLSPDGYRLSVLLFKVLAPLNLNYACPGRITGWIGDFDNLNTLRSVLSCYFYDPFIKSVRISSAQ